MWYLKVIVYIAILTSNYEQLDMSLLQLNKNLPQKNYTNGLDVFMD
jgi:hypothetical protein